MYTLYYAPGTCALATHIALIEAGASYDTKRLDFRAGQQRTPEFLAVNPKGRVPALGVPGGGVLTETPAILVYLAQAFPAAKLAPLTDQMALARVQEFNSYLCSTVHVHHAHRTRPGRWSDDQAVQEGMKKKVAQNMGDAYQLIEDGLLKGPWVMGDTYTVCDPYLFTITGWLADDGVDMKRFANVHAHYERMRERPAVKRALAEQGVS